jgi:hypothetical protein
MAALRDYEDKYPSIRLERRKGVLQMTLHHEGGELVVLAAEDTVFQDATHFLNGIPPADGMYTIWTTLLGLNRGRDFLLTGRVLTAQEALEYGAVSEVLPRQDLLPPSVGTRLDMGELLPGDTARHPRGSHPRVAPATSRSRGCNSSDEGPDAC